MQFYKTDKWVFYENEPHYTDEEWKTWNEEYTVYFDTIREKLPKGFSSQGFHDFIISDLRIQNKKPNKINIEIQLDGIQGLEKSTIKYY